MALDDRSFPNLIYGIDGEWQALVSLLRRLNLSFVHLHHAGHPALSRLPRELGQPYYLTAHDYSWICPQTTLIDESGAYCGEPPVEGCEKCLRLNGSHPLLAGWFAGGEGGVAELRKASAELAAGARRVICPSRDVLERMRRYFPGARLEAQPHPESTPVQRVSLAAPPGDRLRVAVIGAIGPHKGFEILVSCARYAWERRIPIDFVVIGHVCRPQEVRGLPNVIVTGPYKESEVFDRIREQGVSIAFFPAVWPETYSFALSVALAAGLFPVAFDIGAIAERIRETGYGHLLKFTRDPAKCVAALLEAAPHAGQPPPAAAGAAYASILRDYYGSPAVSVSCGSQGTPARGVNANREAAANPENPAP
jgi:glycosyltransferase involved in cell wall biosynthesis